MTGERRFLDASLAATEWIMTTVRTEDDTCAAFHHEPDGTELFTLGWCHGLAARPVLGRRTLAVNEREDLVEPRAGPRP